MPAAAKVVSGISVPGSTLAPRNWRLASWLIVLVALPTAAALMLAGLKVADAARTASEYSQTARVAAAGQQIIGLAQAMEDERDAMAAFIADGSPASGLVALRRQYALTDSWAVRVRRLVLDLGRGYPAPIPADSARVIASIAELPGLRERAQQHVSAMTVINGYSAAITGLLPIDGSAADIGGNSALGITVRTLGALSGLQDQASLQQAVLGAALAEDRFGRAALATVTASQAQQAGDLALFRSSATPEQSWALTRTLASPLARQATAVEQRATAAGDGTLALGNRASQQWQAGMSYTVDWMRGAERQLAGWVTTYAGTEQSSAMRSAMIAGGAALAVLLLVVLATMLVARSLGRPLRRLDVERSEAVRLAGEEAGLRDSVSAVFAGFLRRNSVLLEPLLRLIDGLELGEDDPERLAVLFRLDHLATRMRRNADSAQVLAGQETPRRWTEPVTLVDVLRAAVSEIEQYDRVSIEAQPPVCIVAGAAVDMVHLLAELLENATSFSPTASRVTVSGHTERGGGVVIGVTDCGNGIPEEQLRQLNWQLAEPPLADAAVAGHMGLFAVGHLAARHGVRVTLEPLPGGGTGAEVRVPPALVTYRDRSRQAGAVVRFRSSRATDRPEAVPLLLGAPLPSRAPAEVPVVTVPEPSGAEAGGLPIFDSVESEYPGRGSGLTAAGLPQRTAQTARSRLASFQHGSRRAREEARMPRDAKSDQGD